MTTPKSFTAPRPEVPYLSTLLRKVENGEIRVPDFQRKYVWKEKQVIELLESVYRGYPIGSLLFWRAESSQLRYDAARSYPMPVVDKAREPVNFVLDGQQRLSTLYGCLYLPQKLRKREDIFHVLFDLRKRQFFHFEHPENRDGVMPLWSLFSPSEFLDMQRKLKELGDGTRLLDESVKLHTTFQEYIVPTVTIEKRRVNEVVEIFERVNRTGTNLSSVDFMRAVTWSSDFDLKVEVKKAQRKAQSLGFKIEPETIVKILAISLDKEPTPDAMLELRTLPAARLKAGMASTRESIAHSVQFLQSELNIFSEDFVPYQGQMLVLCRLFMDRKEALNDRERATARRWFLATSLNEALRGKPDHVVAGLVQRAKELADGSLETLDTSLRIDQREFNRRVIRGKALSAGALTVLAMSAPRSIINGRRIAPKHFMSKFNPERFIPLLSLAQVQKALDEEAPSARLLANVIVGSTADLEEINDNAAGPFLLSRREDSAFETILNSQVISRRAFSKLEKQDYAGFLRQRSIDLLERARTLTSA